MRLHFLREGGTNFQMVRKRIGGKSVRDGGGEAMRRAMGSIDGGVGLFGYDPVTHSFRGMCWNA